jgi:hypothetical protein
VTIVYSSFLLYHYSFTFVLYSMIVRCHLTAEESYSCNFTYAAL